MWKENMWEEKKMQEKKKVEEKKSLSQSSQQEQHKHSQKSGVESPREKDSEPGHEYDRKLADKLRHAIE